MRLSSAAQSRRGSCRRRRKRSLRRFFQAGRFPGQRARYAVELAGFPLREGVALTLLGVDMDHHRAGELLGPCQHIAQAGQVVAVDGSQIGEAHVFKESASRPQCLFQAGFQPMVKTIDGGLGGRLSKEAPIPFLKVVVGRFAAQLGKMIRQSPHIGVDGHAVVVQNERSYAHQRPRRCSDPRRPVRR